MKTEGGQEAGKCFKRVSDRGDPFQFFFVIIFYRIYFRFCLVKKNY
jgi:hypothetical protein